MIIFMWRKCATRCKMLLRSLSNEEIEKLTKIIKKKSDKSIIEHFLNSLCGFTLDEAVKNADLLIKMHNFNKFIAEIIANGILLARR